MNAQRVPDGYSLAPGMPDAATYLRLRERAGLGQKRIDQAEPAIRDNWAAVRAVHHEAAGSTPATGSRRRPPTPSGRP